MAKRKISEAMKQPETETTEEITRISEVELWPLSRIKPYKKNAKRHPKEQIDMLARIVKKHGFDQPIVVDSKGVIIKGHGRWLAATELKMTSVPVIVRADLDAASIAEARIADNRISEFGWDYDALIADVVGSMKHGLDPDMIVFTLKELGLEGRVEEGGDVRGEWEPDLDKIEGAEENGEAPDVVFKIVCRAGIAPKVREVLEQAVSEAGLDEEVSLS